MSPQLDEIKLAARILVEAHGKSWAPLSLEGTLYDRASYRYYWGILQRARANGLPIDNEAQRLFFAS